MHIENAEVLYFPIGLLVGVALGLICAAIRDDGVKKEDK